MVGISDDTVDTVEGYIDLSKTVCAAGSDAPLAGDEIVQLGYRGDDDPDRQTAIIQAGAGEGAPYNRQYTGINSFTLPEPETQLKPGDNIFSGKVHMSPGSSGFENFTDVEFGKSTSSVIPGLPAIIIPPSWRMPPKLRMKLNCTINPLNGGLQPM